MVWHRLHNRTLRRRRFLAASLRGVALTPLLTSALGSLRLSAQTARPGHPLRQPQPWDGSSLTVAPAEVELWPGYRTAVLGINSSVPGPTLRVRAGMEFVATIKNRLADPLVLHWHGVLAPADMDGHPRDEVPPGSEYTVRFPIRQRAASCWYHAHTDRLTASQAYRGVAGLFLIEDPAEPGLGLPTGERDIPMVLTDKRFDANRQLVYAPSMMDLQTGYLGTTVLVNGTPEPWLSVDQGVYRLRLLNASNARIYRVGWGDGRPFFLVGTDGGLLPAPRSVSSVWLAPGQRLDLLADFRADDLGSSRSLRSLPFSSGGGMMGGAAQGTEFELLRCYLDHEGAGHQTIPTSLPAVNSLSPQQASRTRVFTLGMSGMTPTINGQTFNLQRIDFTLPFGDIEIWEYRNTGTVPHPMHAHGALSQVLSRSTTPSLPPEDSGWKDTVLVNPGETVRVLIRFDAHPGRFVHHCHNLEHEDAGMMQTFEVLPPPTLRIERGDQQVVLAWPGSDSGWQPERSPSLTIPEWQPVPTAPVLVDGEWTVSVPSTNDSAFYRLVKR